MSEPGSSERLLQIRWELGHVAVDECRDEGALIRRQALDRPGQPVAQTLSCPHQHARRPDDPWRAAHAENGDHIVTTGGGGEPPDHRYPLARDHEVPRRRSGEKDRGPDVDRRTAHRDLDEAGADEHVGAVGSGGAVGEGRFAHHRVGGDLNDTTHRGGTLGEFRNRSRPCARHVGAGHGGRHRADQHGQRDGRTQRRPSASRTPRPAQPNGHREDAERTREECGRPYRPPRCQDADTPGGDRRREQAKVRRFTRRLAGAGAGAGVSGGCGLRR